MTYPTTFEINNLMKHEVKEIQKRTIKSQAPNEELPDFYLNDEQLETLRDFCDSLNPYGPMSLEEKLRLSEYGITDLSNPFEVTNKLLLLLENNLQFRA